MSERTDGRAAYVPDRDRDADLHRQIDHAYDKAETFVAGLGRILGADTSGGVAADGGHAEIGHVTTHSLPAREQKQIAATVTPTVTARPFEIIEVLGRAGQPPIWVVTNGKHAARCDTRAMAEAVLAHVQKALAP